MTLKAGIISQARMNSTRLPGKIFIEVRGKPMLKYHVDRLIKSNIPIYLATTSNPDDEKICEFARKEGLPFYRGSEENVLSRYYECAKSNKLDIIIRVTSDCPLIDGTIISHALESYRNMRDLDAYLSNVQERTYPRGFDFEIFSFRLLEDAYYHASAPSDLEHVTPFINKNKSGKVNLKHFKNQKDSKDLRVTLDTPEDLSLIKKIIEEYHADTLSFEEIVGIFENHPELAKINAHIEQKKV